MAGPDDDDENDDNQNDRPTWPRPLKMYVRMMTNDDNQPAWPRRGGQCDGCSDNRRCRYPTQPKPDHHY